MDITTQTTSLARNMLKLGYGIADTRREFQRAVVIQALQMAKGSRAEAARILGIERQNIYPLIVRHKLK